MVEQQHDAAQAAPDGAWGEPFSVRRDDHVLRGMARLGAEGPALVLLHCIALDHRMWEPLVRALPPATNVVAPTARGHADARIDHFTIDDCVEDVRQVLDQLGLERVHLAGISMGGAVAQEFAIRYHDRLESLTLMSTSMGRPAATDEPSGAGEGAAPVPWDEREDGMVRRWLTPAFATSADPRVGYVRRAVRRWDPAGWSAVWTGLRARRHTGPRLREVGVRTLCVAGTADVSTPVSALEAVASSLPGASLVRLDGPHLLPLEHPGDVAAVLTRHVHG